MSSPTGSSEETSLLGSSSGAVNGSLNQPFMASYTAGGIGGATAPPASATTGSEAEAARIAAITAGVNRMKAPVGAVAPTLTARQLMRRSLLNVAAYLSAGTVIYHWLAGMSFLDAVYFCVVTLTTVGYGDLSAHKPGTKLFACLYILLGVALVASFLAQLVELLLDQQEDLMMTLLEKSKARRKARAMGVDLASDAEKVETGLAGKLNVLLGRSNGSNDDDDDRRTYVGVATGVFWFLLLVGVGTGVFKVSGHMSFIDALYLTVVSSSTVGYGDYYPATEGTRLFAIFFLPLSTLLLGKVISDYTEMRASERTKRRQTQVLLRAVSGDEYEEMDANNDGRVSLLEFTCDTLIRQEKVTEEDLTEIRHRFVALDRDSNGFVTRDEVGDDRDRDGDGFINPEEL